MRNMLLPFPQNNDDQRRRLRIGAANYAVTRYMIKRVRVLAIDLRQ